MFTEFHHHRVITGSMLDDYLALGWYRMGQSIFTTHVLCLKGGMYSAVWVRLDLKDYTFRKSLRKLLRKNGERFRVEEGKFNIDIEKEALYQKHKKRFDGFISNSLRESLLDGGVRNVYNTREFLIYDEEELVGASFFDVGDESIASITGLFDPDYGKHSLGFYTMLLEIQYAIQNNKRYFYPGYVVMGYPSFDYKLRVGNVEGFDAWDGQWMPFDEINRTKLPVEKITHKLELIKKQLPESKNNKIYVYPFYDKVIAGAEEEPLLKAPLFLAIEYHPKDQKLIVVTYDFYNQTYLVGLYVPMDDFHYLRFLMMEHYRDDSYMDFLILKKSLYHSKDSLDIVAFLLTYQ